MSPPAGRVHAAFETGVVGIAGDLDGNGIQTLSAANGVNFDVAGTGNASHKTGWVGGNDALLVRDRNPDGRAVHGRHPLRPTRRVRHRNLPQPIREAPVSC